MEPGQAARVFSALLVAGLVAACNGSDAGPGNSLTPLSGTATPSPAAKSPAGQTAEAGPSEPAGVRDAPGNFFVDPVRGHDASRGTTDSPFATLERALEAARTFEGGNVYVAGGEFEEAPYVLTFGVNVVGGFNPEMWVSDPASFPTVLSGSRTPVQIREASGATIERLTIRSSDAAAAGQSSIAISVAASTDVTVRGNVITAGNGAPGTPGESGAGGEPGANGRPGQDAGACPPDRQGGAGGAGPPTWGGRGGTGGAAGGFDGSPGDTLVGQAVGGAGGSGGSTGQDGSPGGKGEDGVATFEPGGGGTQFGFVNNGNYVPADGSHGLGGRSAGAGGGGGGGGGGALVFACGGGGGGGGGGGNLASDEGHGGQGGGASVGILLTDASQAVISGNVISTGNGGAGGQGGSGGVGGPGGKGGSGGARFGPQGAGGRGGDGGKGGDSSAGGGGGGGPSVGIVASEDSAIDQSGNTFQLGQPGPGGGGGRPADPDDPAQPPGDPGDTGLRAEFHRAQPAPTPIAGVLVPTPGASEEPEEGLSNPYAMWTGRQKGELD